MAWVKIPAEHHSIFLEALPARADISTLKMFGGTVAKVNGHLAAAGPSVAVSREGQAQIISPRRRAHDSLFAQIGQYQRSDGGIAKFQHTLWRAADFVE